MTRAAALVAVAMVVAACAARPAKRPRKKHRVPVDPTAEPARACARGEVRACTQLAERLETGDDEVAIDATRARRLVERACDGDHAGGCYALGRMRRDGVGGAIDATAAAAAFARGCELHDPAACTAYALALRRGDGVVADVAAGTALMRDTCAAGHTRACTNLGVILHNGDGAPRNRLAAEAIFERSCNAGDMLACLYQADAIETSGRRHWSRSRALELREEACRVGEGAGCAAAGRMWRDGLLDNPRIPEEERVWTARELFERGCALGDADACQGVYLSLVGDDAPPADLRRAAQMAEAQCTAGHVPSCQSLGYFHEVGAGVDLDLARAESIYRAACATDTSAGAGSCLNLAELLSDRGELLASVLYAVHACQLGDVGGCNAAGLVLVDVRVDVGVGAAGRVLLRHACAQAQLPDDVGDFCGDAGRHHE